MTQCKSCGGFCGSKCERGNVGFGQPKRGITITKEQAIEHAAKDVEPNITLLQSKLAEPRCKDHPDAPHGFDRNASHNEGRYVCECEGWEPVLPPYQPGMKRRSTV